MQARKKIPENKLLKINVEDIESKKTSRLVCQFVGLISTLEDDDQDPEEYTCPDYPHSYSRTELRDTMTKVNRLAFSVAANSARLPGAAYAKQPMSWYAYATLLAIDEDVKEESFKLQFIASSMVWCHSVRSTYGSNRKAFDMVVLIYGSFSDSQIEKLSSCFDRILPVTNFGNSPKGIEDNEYYRITRAKLWAFGLTDYKRVQFMDSDQMVVANMDHYFFRDCYDRNASYAPKQQSVKLKPPAIIIAMGSNSPINSAFYSIEPSEQVVMDFMLIFSRSSWNTETGWMDYGVFDFSPMVLNMSSFHTSSTIQQISSNLRRQKELYPFLPLAATPIHSIQRSTWSFYGSWCDQGMLFYYFYLVKGSGFVIDGGVLGQELIHFVSPLVYLCIVTHLCIVFDGRFLIFTC